MYGGVPDTTALRSVGWEKTSARPKSTTTTCMSCTGASRGEHIMTFSGFRSLWITAREWQ
eukprot:8695986-Pyramimonas_sp.AAC.1